MKCPIVTCKHTLREIEKPKNYYKCFDPPGCGRIFKLKRIRTDDHYLLMELKDGKVVKEYAVQI